jgi:ribose 5-phosphate isomerase B
MIVAIGSDHGGFELKEIIVNNLKAEGHTVQDLGCHSPASVDYPDFAEGVCESVLQEKAEVGILICGTGIGMSMAANRQRKIRAALCHDEYTARMSREHNNANILCLGARVTGTGVAEDIVRVWLTTEFSGGRHLTRIGKFSD